MRAYRLASGRVLPPFGDPVRALHVGLRPLGEWQEQACRAVGLELSEAASLAEVDERPCLVFSDELFFSEMALRHFLAPLTAHPRDVHLAVPDSVLLRSCRVLDDEAPLVDGAMPLPMAFLSTWTGDDPAALLRLPAAPLPAWERSTSILLPPSMAADGGRVQERSVEVALSARVAFPIRHWLHLFRLAQLSWGLELLQHARRHPWRMLALRCWPRRTPWSRLRRMSFVDPSAVVHPTADLEGAIIGPGAVVQAHAHVHRSALGAGVVIGDHSAVMDCVLAERVQVLRASYLALCAAMPGATLSSYKTQLSLFGRECFLTASAQLIDAKLKGAIQVEHESRLVALRQSFLGSCVGHRVTLGAGVAVLPGRAVPNDTFLVGDPGSFARSFEAAAPGEPMTVVDGRPRRL